MQSKFPALLCPGITAGWAGSAGDVSASGLDVRRGDLANGKNRDPGPGLRRSCGLEQPCIILMKNRVPGESCVSHLMDLINFSGDTSEVVLLKEGNCF